MSTQRSAIGAAFAIGLSGSVVGLLTSPAAAAPGQVCYFGECGPGTAPQAPASPSPVSGGQSAGSGSPVQKISEHGSWIAVSSGRMLMIIDKFSDGSQFAIVDRGDGNFGVILKNPRWRLATGQRYIMTIKIDGHAFTAMSPALDETMIGLENASKDFVAALYSGHRARIEVGEFSAEITRLADAAAAMDDAIRYRQTVARAN
jgi:hypothetical protein